LESSWILRSRRLHLGQRLARSAEGEPRLPSTDWHVDGALEPEGFAKERSRRHFVAARYVADNYTRCSKTRKRADCRQNNFPRRRYGESRLGLSLSLDLLPYRALFALHRPVVETRVLACSTWQWGWLQPQDQALQRNVAPTEFDS